MRHTLYSMVALCFKKGCVMDDWFDAAYKILSANLNQSVFIVSDWIDFGFVAKIIPTKISIRGDCGARLLTLEFIRNGEQEYPYRIGDFGTPCWVYENYWDARAKAIKMGWIK